ncbi:hypothetical protein VCUG_02668, partial [Vavraia culicis subsp. floridensis]
MYLTVLLFIAIFLVFIIVVGFAAGYVYSVKKNKEEMNRLMDSQQAKQMGLDNALKDHLKNKDAEIDNSFYGGPINNVYEKVGAVDENTNGGPGGSGNGAGQQGNKPEKKKGDDNGQPKKQGSE